VVLEPDEVRKAIISRLRDLVEAMESEPTSTSTSASTSAVGA
jgi:hypothetical protein